MRPVVAELLRPPAVSPTGELQLALKTAQLALRRLFSIEADLPGDMLALVAPIGDMAARFDDDGLPVQADLIRRAGAALGHSCAPKAGEWDEETLERECWSQIDEAQALLETAQRADQWTTLMPIEVAELASHRVEGGS